MKSEGTNGQFQARLLAILARMDQRIERLEERDREMDARAARMTRAESRLDSRGR